MKRVLDCVASDFARMSGRELKQSIRAAEGRVVLAEVITACTPLVPHLTNAEVAAAFGADLILLNLFDALNPSVAGLLPEDPVNVVRELKRLVGRPVGVNLEPTDPNASQVEKLLELTPGRTATAASFQAAKRLGFDFVCLTGNPKTGVTNRAIANAVELARTHMGDDVLIIAGKMHAAGVANEIGEEILSEADAIRFVEAGADVILVPAPGTVPGITLEACSRLIHTVHRHGALAMTAIGTSQEGADEATIREIALMSKMAGADLHHIGDAGWAGMALPENIMQYSIAIRGRRHTFARMAASVRR